MLFCYWRHTESQVSHWQFARQGLLWSRLTEVLPKYYRRYNDDFRIEVQVRVVHGLLVQPENCSCQSTTAKKTLLQQSLKSCPWKLMHGFHTRHEDQNVQKQQWSHRDFPPSCILRLPHVFWDSLMYSETPPFHMQSTSRPAFFS